MRLIPALLLTMLCVSRPALADEPAGQCPTPGSWAIPGDGNARATGTVVRDAVDRRVILLGEIHDNAAHHRWQLHMLAAIHAYHDNLILGFEMFPRSVQSVLDEYIAGELSDEEFLGKAKWQQVWNFPPEFYLPLFQFARMYGLPMRALNVDRALVSAVSANGWAEIAIDEREGITDPSAASDEYLATLLDVFASHSAASEGSDPPSLDNSAFKRFTEAQLLWDRAMAQGIADVLVDAEDHVKVIGIIGRGHLQFRHGVPHQLDDLGIEDSYVLLPHDIDEAECAAAPVGIADALFAVKPPMADVPKARPRLGVRITDAEAGVQIQHVAEDSVAEAAGLLESDIITTAAGQPVGTTNDLIDIVSRQAPGTWLPLRISRNGNAVDVVARFPTEFK